MEDDKAAKRAAKKARSRARRGILKPPEAARGGLGLSHWTWRRMAACTGALSAGSARGLVQVGEEQVALDLEFLKRLEPDSMLLPLLSARWQPEQQVVADAAIGSAEVAAHKLELDEAAGVDPAGVLLLLKEYAGTGVLRWEDVLRFCDEMCLGADGPSHTSRRASQDTARGIARARRRYYDAALLSER